MSVQQTLQGMIVKATGGFYYVDTPQGQFACRARGLFRYEREKVTPVVGDLVKILAEEDATGTVSEILPRKNTLVRPPLANLDNMVVVVSTTDPGPNLAVMDKYLAILEHRHIPATIVVTKLDLAVPDALAEIYRKAGYPVLGVCNLTGEGVEAVKEVLAGKLSAFSGNSGVGKSSLLNAIQPGFTLEVGDTSKKLGRGRHTTRHVELFTLENGGRVVDTPGFSSIDLEAMGWIPKEELAACFREFAPHLGKCRFNDCSHTREKGCAVLEAVGSGEIPPTRHQNYAAIYDAVKDVKEWQRKGR